MTDRGIVVIGAGLQGSVVALELAQRGEQVVLLERESQPMQGASRHNEGKIHLGFVYALDPTGTTRRRMLEGAVSFGPILDRLCGPLPWSRWRSEGFRYAVMPGSIASPEVLESAYDDLQRQFEELSTGLGDSSGYLGTVPTTLWRQSSSGRGRPLVGGATVDSLYETCEMAIDPRALAASIADRLRREPMIDVRCGASVTRARRTANGTFALSVRDTLGESEIGADVVVNCSWADRLRLDESVGLAADGRAWSFRKKYSVIVRPPHPQPDLVPVTMVQGPFGDVVPWRDGTVYISWYPTARTYFGSQPPAPCDDPRREANQVASRSLEALVPLFPALEGSEIVSSRPGLIVAVGESDVDDPTSSLHSREEFGAEHHDGWWTVNPAKLTTAPLVGHGTAVRIAQEVGVGVA